MMARAALPYLAEIRVLVWVIVGVCAITLLVIGLLGTLGGHDSDDNGPGPGGGGPDLPRPPDDNPRAGEPPWWPEFERQFADYLKHQPSRCARRGGRRSSTARSTAL
jgi:hypothetical protein